MSNLYKLAVSFAALCLINLVAPTAFAENQLAGQPEPHLTDYAESAIHWRAWGDAAFAEADEKSRLVLVSLGNSACHWTSEMRSEAWEQPAFAKLVNENFVPIKVDTLSRPDIWGELRLYAGLTGGGPSTPLNVFLTPGKHPATSFGLSPTKGTESYRTIVKHIMGQWQQHDDYIRDQSKRDLQRLAGTAARKPLAELADLPSEDLFEPFYGSLAANFDPRHGGFDPGFKFPRPATTEGLLDFSRRQRPGSFRYSQCEKMIRRTLDSMLAGAIIDPLDGGIYRYCRDSAWGAPVFERTLVDQALNAEAFANAYQVTGDSRYADAARGILANARRQFALKDGGYAASASADSQADKSAPPVFGGRDLWTSAELKTLLDEEEYAAAATAFGITPRGNVPSVPYYERLKLRGKNALRAVTEDARHPEANSPLASAVEKMLAARNKRPAPRRDDSIVAAHNGLMIGALANASAILGEPEHLKHATAAATAVRTSLYDATKHRLARASRGGHTYGQSIADDYIYLARGMIDLYRAGGAPDALALASELQKTADELFYDPEVGLYHSTPTAQRKDGFLPVWEVVDGNEPSPNGIAALNLLDLAALAGTAGYRERAAGIVKAVGSPNLSVGISLGTITRAALRLEEPEKLAVISAPAGDPAVPVLLAAVRRHAGSEVGIIHLTGQNDPPAIAARAELTPLKPAGAGAKLYLCEDLRPVATVPGADEVAPAMAAFCRRTE